MSYCEQSKEHIMFCCLPSLLQLIIYSIFNSSGLLRSILGNLGAPRHVRLLTYAKCAVHGLEKHPKMDDGMS